MNLEFTNPFFGSDHDHLYHLAEQNPSTRASFLVLNHNTRHIAQSLFWLANQEIQKTMPSFLPQIKSSKATNEEALPLFKRLINHLHDAAKYLDCDEAPNASLSALDRIEWESAHYQSLIGEVKRRTNAAKAADFDAFVQSVAEGLEETIPAGVTPASYWENLKQSDVLKSLQTLNLFDKNIRFLPLRFRHFPIFPASTLAKIKSESCHPNLLCSIN